MLDWNELKQALRPLRNCPWQSLLIILIIAVGVGLGSAFYSAAEAMFLQPVPFDHRNRLMDVEEILKSGHRTLTSAYNLHELRRQTKVLDDVAAYQSAFGAITVEGSAEQAEGMSVDSHFFPLLRVAPALGRGFAAKDEQNRAPLTIILSYAYWQKRFAGDSTILGKEIFFDKQPYTVIGIMPRLFYFPFLELTEEDFWLPLRAQEMVPGNNDKYGIARLKEGVSLHQAQTEVALIASRIAGAFPEERDFSFHLRSYREAVLEDLKPLMFILGGLMVCILLVVCINVAILLLVDAIRSRREVEIRYALGGTRWKITCPFLLRASALALAGGVLGAGLAAGLIVAFRDLLAGFPGVDQIALNIPLLCVAAVVSLGTGILFGVWPAMAATRKLNKLSFSQTSRAMESNVGRSMHRSRRRFVALQLAFSSAFLVVAALLAISFYHLLNISLGIRLDHRLVVSVAPVEAKTEDALQQFYSGIQERLLALPGVDAVTVSSDAPLTAHGERDFRIKDAPAPKDPRERMAGAETVGANYFKVLGMTVLNGRSFNNEDIKGGSPVAIVNEAFAKRFFGEVSPLGKQICIDSGGCPWRQIVGIAADAHDSRIDSPPKPASYVPFWQAQPGFLSNATFTVHSRIPATSVAGSIQKEMRESAPGTTLMGPITLEEMRSRQLMGARYNLWFVATITILALLLAAMGVYGVIAGDVEQRRREIGIRMALGAAPNNIAAMFQRQMLFLLVPGLLAGFALAAAAGRYIASMLFAITPLNPAAYIGAALVLVFVAATSTALPVRRALREPPAEVLRAE